MKELRKAVDEAKTIWKNVGGHIVIENSSLECDGKFDVPLVIRASKIRGCTIEGEGKFAFKNSLNVRLYGINFEDHIEPKGNEGDCKEKKSEWSDDEKELLMKLYEEVKEIPKFNVLDLLGEAPGVGEQIFEFPLQT